MKIDFPHKQMAHCENGAICSLLNFHGVNISEAMVFGIGSGLFFAYMPYVKYYGTPLASFRILQGGIYKKVTKRLDITLNLKRYEDKQAAMDDLDHLLEQGQPVALVCNLYYLPFFPASYRFHYNAHNTIVYGKENGVYLVSDPVLKTTQTIAYDDLLKARFAKGLITIKGDLYYPSNFPSTIHWEKAIEKGIKNTCFNMLVNFPLNGAKGIQILGNKVAKKHGKMEMNEYKKFLGTLIRMQEEGGTGGSGFRFIYGSFLKEAGDLLNIDELHEQSKQIILAGDKWRLFAIHAGKILKERYKTIEEQISIMKETLHEISSIEKEVYKSLRKIKYS